MMNLKQTTRLTVGLLCLRIVAPAFGGESTNPDMTAQISALQAQVAELQKTNETIQALRDEVARLRDESSDTWLNERRAQEVKALIHDVLTDADTRTSLLANGMTAGHNGKNFFMGSEDGTFLLKIGGQTQLRYIYNSRERSSAAAAGFDEEEGGFQIARARIFFAGHIGSPKITYTFQYRINRNTQTVQLERAFFGYKISDDTTVYIGETKGPFTREEMSSSKTMLAVERSLVNTNFTLARIQGIWIKTDANDYTKLTFAVSDGDSSGNAGGTKDFQNDKADYALTARADVKLAGNWSQITDYSAWSGEDEAVFVGAAIHYEAGESGDGQTAAVGPAFNPPGAAIAYDDFLSWTVDGSIEANGANLFASVTGLHVNAIAGASDIDAYGLVIQGGYMIIPDKLEPFLRWELIDPDSTHKVNLVTVGANYYLNKHRSKFTADLVVALNSLDNFSSSGLGLLADTAGETGQFAIRTQFQLLF